jgi:hypothetical protein
LFGEWDHLVSEWHRWFEAPAQSQALFYWLGDSPTAVPPVKRGRPLRTIDEGEWWLLPEARIAIAESGYWWMRWDLSPLGFLKTAAHGHLDALHLSIWIKGVALVIDPGTGAYHADRRLRNWLASRDAHNAPCPVGVDYPRRLGPFLWAEHHPVPEFRQTLRAAVGTLTLPQGKLVRSIRRTPGHDGWEIGDAYQPSHGGIPRDFTVRWQFAPGSWVKRHSDRKFSVHRADVAVTMEVDENWAMVELVETVTPWDQNLHEVDPSEPVEGIVSPAFRKICRAPYLKLVARPGEGGHSIFQTTFRATAG